MKLINQIIDRLYSALALSMYFLLSGCGIPSTAFVAGTIPNSVIQGQVVSRATGQPVFGALVLATAPSGGFVNNRIDYLYGHTTTDAVGHFVLKIEGQHVLNLSRPDSPMAVTAYHRDFQPSHDSLQAGTLRGTEILDRPIRLFDRGGIAAPDCGTLHYTACKLVQAVYR